VGSYGKFSEDDDGVPHEVKNDPFACLGAEWGLERVRFFAKPAGTTCESPTRLPFERRGCKANQASICSPAHASFKLMCVQSFGSVRLNIFCRKVCALALSAVQFLPVQAGIAVVVTVPQYKKFAKSGSTFSLDRPI
jgi:hypothetical protein